MMPRACGCDDRIETREPYRDLILAAVERAVRDYIEMRRKGAIVAGQVVDSRLPRPHMLAEAQESITFWTGGLADRLLSLAGIDYAAEEIVKAMERIML